MINTLVTICALVFCTVATPAALLVTGPAPKTGAPVLVVTPHFHEIIADAGGRIIAPQTAPLAALAVGDAQFLAALDNAGAWFVVDGTWIAEICGIKT